MAKGMSVGKKGKMTVKIGDKTGKCRRYRRLNFECFQKKKGETEESKLNMRWGVPRTGIIIKKHTKPRGKILTEESVGRNHPQKDKRVKGNTHHPQRP